MTIDKVKLRDKKNTIYLPSTSYKDFYRNNFTIVYPNNGTKEAPANITVNSRYIIENPFPGYYVSCIGEIFVNGEWGHVEWESFDDGGVTYPNYNYRSSGYTVYQHNDNQIILLTAVEVLCHDKTWNNQINGTTFNNIGTTYTAPARIKVWKVGIIDE